MTQAQAFVQANRDYLFQDAHFLVEAQASAEAQEFAHNKFRFADGSVLEIDNTRGQVFCREA